MNNKSNTLKSIALVFWSVLMTAFTLVLGAVPLKVLRLALGRGPYWLLIGGLSLSFWGMGWVTLSVAIFSMAVLVGFYTELELRKFPLQLAGSFAIVAGALSASALFFIWTTQVGPGWYALLLENAQAVIDRVVVTTASSAEALQVEALMAQAPSGILIVLTVALALSLMFEGKLLAWFGVRKARKESLTGFKLPEILIWVFILSLLGSFIKTELVLVQSVSTNVLNMMVLLYFFQGLAVVSRFLEVHKFSPLWRVIVYSLIVLQLFLAVSFIGVIDYWLDFRSRIKPKAERLDKRV